MDLNKKILSSLTTLIFVMVANNANAIILYDCEVGAWGGPQSNTNFFNNKCWLEIELEEAPVNITAVRVQNLTYGKIWEGYDHTPQWDEGPFNSSYSTATEGPLYRYTQTPSLVYTQSELKSWTWAIKYESMNAFGKPVLYAPLTSQGTYYYWDVNDTSQWHYVQSMTLSDYRNMCNGCGVDPVPWTP